MALLVIFFYDLVAMENDNHPRRLDRQDSSSSGNGLKMPDLRYKDETTYRIGVIIIWDFARDSVHIPE